QGVGQVAGVEGDLDGLAVVGDRQVDVRAADVGGLAGELEHAVGELEVDAPALLAGDDRGLLDRHAQVGDLGEADLDLDVAGEDVLVAGEPTLDQPAVDDGLLGPDQHRGPRLDGQVDRGVVVVEVAFDQL